MHPIQLEPGSFRDKSNRVFYMGEKVYRALNRQALAHWESLQKKSFYQTRVGLTDIVRTQLSSLEVLPPSEKGNWAAVLEHEPIPFISYPYEWSFGMMKDAALLQLELLQDALKEDVILKDASPFNVQWKGAQPIFIDIPSFVPLTPGQPWEGYRQFCELFLYPLFLQAYRGVPFQPWLRGALDGIPTEDAHRLLGRYFYKPGIFTDVLLHAHFKKRYAKTEHQVKDHLQKAGFRKEFIQANLARLSTLVGTLSWKTSKGHWSHYADIRNYSNDDLTGKTRFIERVLKQKRRRMVWDLGCNTGEFTRLAAEHADYVVSVDSDAEVVETLYQSLKSKTPLNVLPLVGNLVDLSSGLGWRGRERKAFVDRGRPELILCLALVHHVAISHNIPIVEWVQWLSGLGQELIIEFVTPEDAMVQQLLKNKEGNHSDYTTQHFEDVLSQFFNVSERHVLGSGRRILYAGQSKQTQRRENSDEK